MRVLSRQYDALYASLPGYVYATAQDTVYVNLYAAGTADIAMEGGRKVKVVQDTEYPWQGNIRISVHPQGPGPFALKLRIPDWARGEITGGDLYRFIERPSAPVTLKVNGEPIPLQLDKGYVTLNRDWRSGDRIELALPMDIRKVRANEKVAADRGRLAIQRGPLVYAAEWVDNPGGRVRNLVVAESTPLQARFEAKLLGGVTVVKGRAIALAYSSDGKLTRNEQEFTAIPYFAWANRGSGQMAVWLADSGATAKPAPAPTLAMASKVTTSGLKEMANGIKEPRMINDGDEPSSSADRGSSYEWGERGTAQWVGGIRVSEDRDGGGIFRILDRNSGPRHVEDSRILAPTISRAQRVEAGQSPHALHHRDRHLQPCCIQTCHHERSAAGGEVSTVGFGRHLGMGGEGGSALASRVPPTIDSHTHVCELLFHLRQFLSSPYLQSGRRLQLTPGSNALLQPLGGILAAAHSAIHAT
ncbi:MAG TPA: hypothetical protein VER03_00385 [Bryobacteraceae bacterium]|nr:hypothetical protein [Bryobacteraceae bacterium]